MARIRSIKPEFHDDEKLATIPRDARLLFIAMWNFSDDYGVIKGHPVWIKNKVFPYDEIKQATFNEWLLSLEKLRCIIPFEANGEKFYFIRTFHDHQRVDKPSQTRNPEPPTDILERNRSLFDEDSTNTPRGLPVGKEGKGKEGNRKGEYTEPFLVFYGRYPKKEGKTEAQKAWTKLNPQNGLQEKILTAIENQSKYKKMLRDSDQFCPEWPNPSTWLNQRRWEDEIPKEIEGDKPWYERNSKQ